jgi:pimeloyl-ACP methyl ester carboxylesterase
LTTGLGVGTLDRPAAKVRSPTMNFTRERSENGVTERLFDLSVAGETVPGVIWAPEGAQGPRPLVLMGHGGAQHKKIGSLATRARRYAQGLAYAVAAIDAPGHGARVTREEAARLAAEIQARIAAGKGLGGQAGEAMARRAAQAVPEWKAALDAMRGLDFVGADGPVGYWGVSMGTAIGVPFVASEPRIVAAVFGLAGLRPGADQLEAAARAIEIPVEFVFQWDDEIASREAGIALFNAFGGAEKTLHANPGGHLAIPAFEGASWERFFIRHLGRATAEARVAPPAN